MKLKELTPVFNDGYGTIKYVDSEERIRCVKINNPYADRPLQYFDENGFCHRDGGRVALIEWKGGVKWYSSYKHGKLHAVRKPAVVGYCSPGLSRRYGTLSLSVEKWYRDGVFFQRPNGLPNHITYYGGNVESLYWKDPFGKTLMCVEGYTFKSLDYSQCRVFNEIVQTFMRNNKGPTTISEHSNGKTRLKWDSPDEEENEIFTFVGGF